jgi:hypothetical protein
MADVVDNMIVEGLSGKLGNQIMIRRLRNGRTIVCKKPDFSQRKLSSAQKEHHQRVKQASAYARSHPATTPFTLN